MTSQASECLINVPPIQYYDSLKNPGRLWSADDQCKLIYGNQASFCQVECFNHNFFPIKNYE